MIVFDSKSAISNSLFECIRTQKGLADEYRPYHFLADHGQRTSQDYPVPQRRVSYYDKDTHKRLVFLTNNFTLEALIIAKLYQCRWPIELFFKWLKQNLHIKAFLGTSDNAVKTQIGIAVSVYVLIAIIKKELQLQHSLAEILQILSIALFEQVPLQQILTQIPMKNEISQNYKQLPLFNL